MRGWGSCFGAWQVVCVARGMCGRGVCMAGGMHGRVCAWPDIRPLQWTVRIVLECIPIVL